MGGQQQKLFTINITKSRCKKLVISLAHIYISMIFNAARVMVKSVSILSFQYGTSLIDGLLCRKLKCYIASMPQSIHIKLIQYEDIILVNIKIF